MVGSGRHDSGRGYFIGDPAAQISQSISIARSGRCLRKFSARSQNQFFHLPASIFHLLWLRHQPPCAVSRVSKPANAAPFRRPADSATGDTAGWETCDTPMLPTSARVKHPASHESENGLGKQPYEITHRRCLGSTISCKPCPSRLKASTVSTMAKPGTMTKCGYVMKYGWPSEIMEPQVGAGGGTPMPR